MTIYWALKKYEDTGLTPEEIERLKEQHRWIPVEERLPEESLNSVIGWDEYRERCCFVQYYAGSWHLGDESVRIIAWMPLPEPFRRRETVMNKSVTDILEEVCSDICDNYCKYRDTVDEGGKCEAIRTGLRCPLDRLNLRFWR